MTSTLLVFADLFSAVVTAFTIESYQWLVEVPADTIVTRFSSTNGRCRSCHSSLRNLNPTYHPSESTVFGSLASPPQKKNIQGVQKRETAAMEAGRVFTLYSLEAHGVVGCTVFPR
ncbi:hypothetical protein WG66_011353 [Moniliophthora roreri]|nr:hypothetical protein WG66_011353 [Moniliophthora roreri]KAI3620760.1 hypothetical protein WG66_011353 [Moniliophthora roreri]